MSKRSHFCDLQKYGALNSSLRQMICAPASGRLTYARDGAIDVASRVGVTASWMIPTVTGVVIVVERLIGLAGHRKWRVPPDASSLKSSQ